MMGSRLAEIIEDVGQFLELVSVRHYLIPAERERAAIFRLTDRDTNERWHDLLLGDRTIEPASELELSTPHVEEPPLDYGTLEIEIEENPQCPQMPIAALCLTGPGMHDAPSYDCAIAELCDALDAAIRRLLKRVEESCKADKPTA